MVREGVPISEFESLYPDSPIKSGSRSLAGEPDLEKKIFSDPEFLAILEIRRRFLEHTVEEFDDLIAATDSILTKIDASLVE